MTGKVAIVSFDKDPETFSWIDRGGINATVTQKPYVMAFYGLKFVDDLHHNAVHEFKDWRTAPAPSMPSWVDTGTAIVDKIQSRRVPRSARSPPQTTLARENGGAGLQSRRKYDNCYVAHDLARSAAYPLPQRARHRPCLGSGAAPQIFS